MIGINSVNIVPYIKMLGVTCAKFLITFWPYVNKTVLTYLLINNKLV